MWDARPNLVSNWLPNLKHDLGAILVADLVAVLAPDLESTLVLVFLKNFAKFGKESAFGSIYLPESLIRYSCWKEWPTDNVKRMFHVKHTGDSHGRVH